MTSPVGPGDDRPVPGQGGLGPPPRLPPAARPCRPPSPPHGRTSVRAPLPPASGPEQGGLGPPPPPPAAVRLPPRPRAQRPARPPAPAARTAARPPRSRLPPAPAPASRPTPPPAATRPHVRTSAPPPRHPASRPSPAGPHRRGLHRGRIAQAAGEPEPEKGRAGSHGPRQQEQKELSVCSPLSRRPCPPIWVQTPHGTRNAHA